MTPPTEITEHRIAELERRTTTLEHQILQALLELSSAVGSVKIVTERLVSFEARFVAHDAAEAADRQRLMETLHLLSDSIGPVVKERAAVGVVTGAIVRASVVLGAAVSLAAWGPRVWALLF